MSTVFHPASWLQQMPKGAKFYLSEGDMLVEHPNLPADQRIRSPYIGEINAETCVLQPVAPQKAEAPVAPVEATAPVVVEPAVPTIAEEIAAIDASILPAPAPEPQSVPAETPAPKPVTKRAKPAAQKNPKK